MYVLVHCKSDDRNLFIVVIFTLQRSIEKSRLKRKLQKSRKSCKAKICKQAKDLVVVPSILLMLLVSIKQSSTDQSSTSLVRKLSIGKRATEEVNAMLLAISKKRLESGEKHMSVKIAVLKMFQILPVEMNLIILITHIICTSSTI